MSLLSKTKNKSLKKLLKNVPKIIKCSIISSKNVLKFCPNQRSISDGPKLGRHVGNRTNGEVGEIVAPTSRSFQLHKVPPEPPVRVEKYSWLNQEVGEITTLSKLG